MRLHRAFQFYNSFFDSADLIHRVVRNDNVHAECLVHHLRNGFRLVVFSLIIMVVVLFFRKGIMGDKELPDLLKKRQKKATKEAVQP